MKQLTTLILSLMIVFSMCACGSQEAPAETISAAEETTVPVTEESVPETTVPESTVPEEAEAITVHFVTTTDTEVSQVADNLSVTLQNDQLSVTVSDLVVKEDYVTNQASTPERRSEYLWEIQLFMGVPLTVSVP